MLAKACQIWGIVLLSVTLLRFVRLNQDICPAQENPCIRICVKANDKCDQQCNSGSYNCSLQCSGEVCAQGCDAKRCNFKCSSEDCDQRCNGGVEECIMHYNGSKFKQKCDASVCHMTGSAFIRDIHEQTCNGGVKRCDAQCNVSAGTCKQHCDAELCKLECSGKDCDQKCNGGTKQCIMHCRASKCKQTCAAHTCSTTKSGLVSSLTEQKCNSGKSPCCQHIMIQNSIGVLNRICVRKKRCTCSKYSLNTNYITLRTSNVFEVVKTQPSTTQAHASYGSPSPLSFLSPSPLLSSSSSLYSPTSSSLSSSILSSSSSSSSPSSLLSPPPRSSSSSSRLRSPSSSSLSPSTSHSYPSLLPPSSLSPSSSSSPNLTSPLVPLVTFERLANEYVSKLGAIELHRESSLRVAMRLFNNFTNQYQNITKTFEGQLSEEEVKKGTEAIFKVAVAFEKLVLNYSRYHLNETKLLKKMTDGRMVLSMKIGYQNDPSNFLLKEEEWQTSINISSANFAKNGSVVVGCLYKDLHELLLTKQSIGNETHNSRYVNTRIITAAMDPKPEILQDLILKFRNLKAVEEKKHCMFWSGFSKSPDGYSEDGCHVDTAKSNSEETVCRCNHLTYFAVLVDFDSGRTKLSKKDGTILETITYVGLSLSIIGMLLTIVFYSFFTDVRQPLSQIRLSLSASLGAGQIIFLAGINATENMAACITAAALMQYFLMAAFCWMLVEGIYLYLFVVKVYNINTKMHMYHVISWGLPVVMVAISLSIAAGKEGMKSFTNDTYCWLSSTNKPIWIFVTFVAFIESFNILILVRVIKEITTLVEPLAEDNYAQQIRLGVKAGVVMIPLLGVSWLFGFLSPLHKVFTYIFTILNSTQGFLIFVLHCVRNTQIQERFKRKLNTVFPSVYTKNSAMKGSQIDPSAVEDIGAAELQSCDEFELK